MLSALVSGCSLIGEYAENFGDVPSDNQSPVLTETEDKPATKPEKDTKTKLLNVSFNVNESVCKGLLIKLNGAKYIVPNEAVMFLDKDLPKDLIQTAFAELKKRKKFSPIEDMRGITLFSLMEENETYYDVDESTYVM